MSKQRLKEKKKKDREKESKKKVALRREKIREKTREENKEFHHEKRIKKLRKEMGDLDMWADDVYKKIDENTLLQLEKNVQILKGLEREFKNDSEEKQKINEELESKGLFTLEDKIKHIREKLIEEQNNFSHEVENRQIISEQKKPPKEIAEVEVVKAKI